MRKQIYSISFLISLILAAFVGLTFTSCKTDISGGNENGQEQEKDKDKEKEPEKPEEKTLSSIYISSTPNKLKYVMGEMFDLSGLEVRAKYSDDSEEIITDYSCSREKGSYLFITGTVTVTIEYKGKTASFEITVNEEVEQPEEQKSNKADPFFWGTWVRMDKGWQYEILETTVKPKSGGVYKILAADSDSLKVEGFGTFKKESDSVIVCENIPYFRNGGANLEYSLKLVGFTQGASSSQASLSRAAGISMSGISGKGKSLKYKDFESKAESDSDGNIKFIAPTANDPQTVTITNGNDLVVIPGLTINNTGDYMGTVALVGKDAYNLKITGTISDDQKDDGYLFGNNAKEYEMIVTITNISDIKCKTSLCTIESDDKNLTLVSKDDKVPNIEAFTISTLTGGATKEIKIGVKYGNLTEPFVNTGIKITIENPETNQEWSDYIPLRFFKGLIPITVAGQSTERNEQAALNGFIIYPDGNNQFFRVPENSSQILFVPSFGKDKKYKMVFSGATVTSTLSDSTEMYYTVAPGTTKTRPVETLVDKNKLREYLLFGGNNHSENNAFETTEDFQAYLSSGEIDYYSIQADSDEFYAPGAKSFYSVSYDSDYGTLPSGFYIAEDSVLTAEKLPVLEYPGMSFLGWYVGSTLVNDGSYTVKGDVTLKAQWNIANYQIEYVLDGGTNDMENPPTYKITDETFELKAPERDYYTFDGWYTSANFAEDKIVTEIEKGTYGDIKLYAKWKPISYKIRFHISTGYFPETTIIGSDGRTYYIKYNAVNEYYEMEYDVTSKFELPPAVREHYGLEGWYTISDFSEGRIESIENKHEYIDLWAHWETGKYRISYYLSGGTNNIANPSKYEYESGDIFLKAPTRSGCTFDGWYTKSSFDEDSKIQVIPSHSEGDIILYAKWIPITYTITYVLFDGTNAPENPETYTVESPTIKLKAPSKPGYNFEGWISSSLTIGNDAVIEIASGTYKNLTLYASWTPIEYSVKYNLNGGTNSYLNPETFTVESRSIELAAPTRIGYKFEGWYTSSSFEESTKYSVIAEKTIGNIELYAKWSIINYTVTYVLSGGTNNAANKTSYTINDLDFKLGIPTFKEYEFGGWFDNQNFGGEPVTKIETSRLEDIVLYAKWNIEIYSVKYNLNGGTNSSENPLSFTGESETLNLVAASKLGYAFDGWYKTRDFSGEKFTKIPSGSNGSIELWAKWTPIDYAITYNLNGGTNAAGNPEAYNIENANLTLTRPSKDYYTFGGWYFDEALSINAVSAGAGTGTNTDKVLFRKAYADDEIGEVALYAKWIPKEYSITYNLNSGTNASGNPESFTVETSTITLKAPSRFAYTFKGWYTSSSFAGEAVTSIPKGSHDNIKLWAKWEEIKASSKITVSAPVYTEIAGLTGPEVDISTGTITFTAPANYAEYAWYADDSDTPLGTSKTLVINLSTTKLRGGYHLMTLEVVDLAGKHYSAQYEFSFEK
ncbi:MAG: InlB B-repeat-containing protein [Treponema sp.]|nr:InlB B-repeat-containing protein [Treponema sp.]